MQLPLWGTLWAQGFLGVLTLVVPRQSSPGSCPFPPKVIGAELKREFQSLQYFPLGMIVKYDCIRGFEHVPGTENFVSCTSDLKWSKPEMFCKESCLLPPVLTTAILQVEFRKIKYFPLGAVVKYDCRSRYERVPGTDNSIRCDSGYRWSPPQEFCKVICPLPPNLMGATLNKEYAVLKHFFVGMEVKYDCKEGYSHVPGIPNSVKCEDNRKWSQPGMFCQRSCPLPPKVTGAKLQRTFVGLQYFPVGMIVMYDCDGQYKHVPHTKNSITCGSNHQWSRPEVFCKESCPLPPNLKDAKLKVEFEGLEYFPIGRVVKYDCKEGYKHLPGTKNSVRCGDDLEWSQPEVFCQVSCDLPPNLLGAKLKREFEGLEYFPSGAVVKYDCDRGFKHIPGTENSVRCGDGFKWSQPEVFCKAVECDDPVIEHGIKLTGFRERHIYGNNIAFECNIGYFMIGSYLIQCGENNTWNPQIPACEKITADLCGPPLVPSGSVYPQTPQYDLGTYVIIECYPQYSFPDETMEMTTKCQGYNLWKPPAQPCMFRTSPDTSVLTVRNGRIVRGKKEKYKPGDNVTIKCHAGFQLQGPSVIRYIGGKKWSPRIPYCSLSFFFILLIAAIIFFVLLVLVKRVRQRYSE